MMLGFLLAAPACRKRRRETGLCAGSRNLQFPQHFFSIDKPAGLDILLRSDQGSMQGGAVRRVEPVARIYLSSLEELRRLVHHEPTLVNAGLESHAERILWSLLEGHAAGGWRISDLTKYVRTRAARDPEFAENFEAGYADFKIGALLGQAREKTRLELRAPRKASDQAGE
jgi:hypothetical protein